MPRKTSSSALRGQLETAAVAAAAATRWFRAADPAALKEVRTAQLRARGWREGAVARLRASHGPAADDAADLSFSLREAVEHCAAAVRDAKLWGVEADAEFAAIADGAARGARALARAADVRGVERAAALDEARRWCADAERRRRAVRAGAQEAPVFVDGVKRGGISASLSSAVEALQQACDALAGSLAE